MFSFTSNYSTMEKRLAKLAQQSPEAFQSAMEKAAIQFLTWCNNGSKNEPRKPPIRRGFLRGSSSAFVGNKLVGVYGANDNKYVARTHSAPSTQVTWGWNAEYATKMHEGTYNLGPYSEQDGDAGNKWLEKHLQADREDFSKLVATFVGKDLGML